MDSTEGLVLLNLTPHDVSYCDAAGRVLVVFPTAGSLRLVSAAQTPLTPLRCGDHALEVAAPPAYTDVAPRALLPEVQTSVLVSMVVAQWMQPREEFAHLTLYVPDTGPESAVRDERGRIVGVRRLTRY